MSKTKAQLQQEIKDLKLELCTIKDVSISVNDKQNEVVKDLYNKIQGYKEALTRLKNIVAHKEDTITLRDITITRLKLEVSKLEERENNSIRRRAYNKWAEEVCNENILNINTSSSI